MKPEHHGILVDITGGPARQKGALTIFTGIFVLVLMTLMLLYATRVGVFEQRVSANENRQKIAFHAAETALEQAQEYLLANVQLAGSADPEAGPDGQDNDPPTFRKGWFNSDTTVRRWQPCPSTPAATHPCGGTVSAVANSFFYDNPATTDTSKIDSIPLNLGALPANTTARATATVCLLEIAEDSTMSCSDTPPADDDEDHRLLVTLMGYGYSDCTDTTDPGTCKGEATVSVPLANLSNFGTGAGVPLVTKNALPTTGTAEIAVAPNAGGIGVPISVWANGRPANECPPKSTDGTTGSALEHQASSWATCQYHEWFGVDYWPDPLQCPTSSCKCDTDELISGPVGGGSMVVSSDIQVDPTFPCDLFAYYFGTTDWQAVKANAEVYSDCSALGPWSNGFIWIEGDNCLINSNTIIGSEENPVMLVIASKATDVRGGVILYGTMFVTEIENAGATFEANGGMTVYGQVVVDSIFSKLQGTWAVVYDEGILARAAGAGGLGNLNHGWRDWGLPDITWN